MKYVIPPVLLLILSAAAYAQNQAPSTQQINQMFFQQFDTNQDGKVTQAEFLAPKQAQFGYMDKNRDGMIDMAEVQAFTQEMMQRSQMQPKR